MAITKKNIADLIISIKSGGQVSSDSKFDDREIFVLTELVVNTLIANQFQESKEVLGGYIIPFKDVIVLFDEDRNEFYSNLPARAAILPDDLGILQVSPMQDQQLIFIKRKHGALAVFRNLEAGNLLGRTSYYVEGEKIFYINIPKYYKDKGVLVKQIANVDGIDENAQIPISAAKELNLFQIVSQIITEQSAATQEKINDNNANTK